MPSVALKSSIVEKARIVEQALTVYYGERPYCADHYDQDLLGALIATVLSQHTSDLNSGRAFDSLKKTFPDGWESARLASTTQIADAIRSGGLADMKAARIKKLLEDVRARTGAVSLDFLRAWDDDGKILAYLLEFHGVGRKTAACVLMFNLGRPVIAVDTHVHRVSRRLGLIGPKVSADQAHDDLLKLVVPEHAYSFHVHLIEHGRAICHAQRPECGKCPVQRDCDFYHGLSMIGA